MRKPKKHRATKEETVHAKALKYLHRVAATVGAVISTPVWMGDARYDTAGFQFLVSPSSVLRTDVRTGKTQRTCVTHKQWMPPEEMVATILLLLHDNPKRFELWREQAVGRLLAV